MCLGCGLRSLVGEWEVKNFENILSILSGYAFSSCESQKNGAQCVNRYNQFKASHIVPCLLCFVVQ